MKGLVQTLLPLRRFSVGTVGAFVVLVSLVLLFEGCTDAAKSGGGFVGFHDRVVEMLSGRCVVGPVTSDKILGNYFNILPRGSRFEILVREREFFSQEEWLRRYARASRILVEQFGRTNLTQSEASDLHGAFEQLGKMPSWSYAKTGVDVDLQEPELVYPGFEKDQAVTRKIHGEITAVLKRYRTSTLPVTP